MPISLLPSLLLSILAVGYSPGPANLYALSCALRCGRRKALKMWFGLLFGFVVTALIASTAVHFVGLVLGKYISYIKYLGALYLFYIAFKIYRSSLVSEENDESCSFISGALVQMTNAKMILYELSVYSTFVLPYSNRLIDLYSVAALLLIAGPGANFVWLLAGSAIEPFVQKHHKAVNAVMAFAIIACAIMILFF